MKTVIIDCSKIVDEETFHATFAEVMGFPGFYGENMDAWIDCMSWLDASEEEGRLSSVSVEKGQVLTLKLDNVEDFKNRCPQLHEDLLECSGFVNWRRVEKGEGPILALAFYS